MEDPETIQTIAAWLGTGSINLFGRPFAGKDTQGRRLAEVFHGTLIGGGDILRGSTIPDDIKQHMHAGKLIPSEEYVRIVLPYLSQAALADKPLILSSVGRWHGEEAGVIEATKAAGHPLKAVIFLSLDESLVHSRWEALEHHDDRGGRHDDTAEVLKTRLAEFAEKTLPVLEQYRADGLLVEIDASNTPDSVTESILHALGKQASRS